jgi:hypothetical protein
MKQKNIYTTLLFSLIISVGCNVAKKYTIAENNLTKEAMLKAMLWQEANPIFAKAPTDTPDPTWAPDMLQLFVQE